MLALKILGIIGIAVAAAVGTNIFVHKYGRSADGEDFDGYEFEDEPEEEIEPPADDSELIADDTVDS